MTMPSIPSRSELRIVDNNSDSDSEVTETSTFTNSPLKKPLAANNSDATNHEVAAFLSNHEVEEEEDGSTHSQPPQQGAPLFTSVTYGEESESSFHSTCSNLSDDDDDSSSSSISECSGVAPSDVGVTCAKTSPKSNSNSKSAIKKKKRNLPVTFSALSTLYVFEDSVSGKNEYNVENTWYSVQDLKAFRADAFLTVNWMVMKGMEEDSETEEQQLQQQQPSEGAPSKSKDRQDKNHHNYYSEKYGYDRQKEINAIAQDANYEFCERGVECRTPAKRHVKNKRRIDAMRVVLLYQQMQKQNRRERRREQRRRKQRQYMNDDSIELLGRTRGSSFRPSRDPEALRQLQADIDADALASVYGTYCKDSLSEALSKGRSDAIDTGMSPEQHQVASEEEDLAEDGSSSVISSTTTTTDSGTVVEDPVEVTLSVHLAPSTITASTAALTTVPRSHIIPSLCDEDDEFMDKLISLSFVRHDENDDSDSEDSIILDEEIIFVDDVDDSEDEGSISLECFHDSHNTLISEMEASVEVEWVEGGWKAAFLSCQTVGMQAGRAFHFW